MKILVAEDDFVSRHVLMSHLKKYGSVDGAVNGVEGFQAFKQALEDGEAYELIFMDIMMPEMDGLKASKKIREFEKKHGVAPKDEVKIIMATAIDDPKTVIKAYNESEATGYLVKPYEAGTIQKAMIKIGSVG